MRHVGFFSGGLLLGTLFLSSCGLMKVSVNGEEKTFGGSTPQRIDAQPASVETSNTAPKKGGGTTPSGHTARNGKAGAGNDHENKDLKKATRDLIRDLDKALLADGTALSDDKIADLASKRDALSAANLKDDAEYVTHLLSYYRIENAFRKDPASSGVAIAKLLDSTVTTSGELSGSGKPLSFKFKAEAGKCYTVLSHLKNAGGDDDHMADFFLDAQRDNASLQRFTVRQRTTRGAGLMRPLAKAYDEGACALKTVDVTANLTLNYAGTTNGLRYVVVEQTRDSFPTYLALEAEPALSDSCDVDGYTNMWTNPLPGSVVYGSQAPFIPHEIGPAEEMWMTAWDANGGDARVKREDVTTNAPKQLKFPKDYRFAGCPKELKSAHSPDGIRVAQCWEGLDRRYSPQFDAARAAKDNAVGVMADIAADNRMTALNDAYSAEADRTCEKMSADVGKKMSAAYDKIVDFYQATPYKAPFDRGAMLRSTYQGVADIKCVDASNYCTL